MFKTKILATFVIVLAVLFGQVGSVLAAPAAQDATPITGTIKTITANTDANGDPIVIVEVLDETTGITQTVTLDAVTAAGYGLIETDPVTGEPMLDATGLPIPVLSMLEQYIEITPVEEVPDEEPFNPVAGLLAAFFGVDNATINQYHEDGFGFGVIAQALWMAKGLETDNPDITAGLILEAKDSGDYSAFTLPDGSTPANWGQFKKAVLGKEKKNLGVIVSGHAEPETTDEGVQQESGNNKNKDKGNNGNDKGNNGKNKNP